MDAQMTPRISPSEKSVYGVEPDMNAGREPHFDVSSESGDQGRKNIFESAPRAFLELIADLARDEPHPGGILKAQDDIEAAKNNRVQVYVNAGYVGADDTGSLEAFKADSDALADRVEYFGVFDDFTHARLLASACKIQCSEDGPSSLPSYEKCYPAVDDEVKARIDAIAPHEIVEVSGLAKPNGTSPISSLELYRQMLQDSVRKGEKLWFMGVVDSTRKGLQQRFGRNAIMTVGRPVLLDLPYVNPGVEITPIILETEKALDQARQEAIQEKSETKRLFLDLVLRYMANGMPEDHVSEAVRHHIADTEIKYPHLFSQPAA